MWKVGRGYEYGAIIHSSIHPSFIHPSLIHPTSIHHQSLSRSTPSADPSIDSLCLLLLRSAGYPPAWRAPRLHMSSLRTESARPCTAGPCCSSRPQIAVDNGFGGVYGHQKADWMVDVVQQYFLDNDDLQQYEVEDFISLLMHQEFDTLVDDGSLPQVSGSLLQMFGQWQQGALQQLKHSIESLSQRTGQRAKVTAPPTESDDESDAETQTMECEASGPSASRTDPAPPPPPPQDEDGWTVVRKRK
ncbi:Pre-rRNA-processing protein TSR2 -like protein [Takifugu flavidus]|uniref:Pre-rRNA-processing protein TSR2 homolog n=1 Tax=Takifugu flavidus TaxID=433684 RepID=A0A5C6MMQ5_9TELE|nr:Pre-rRNA-processing protein TSR2 -like protein [Takifugu flavidus]